MAIHYRTSRDRAEELARETGGVALQADLTVEDEVDAAVRRGGARARRHRRLRGGCRGLAARRRAGLAAPARALGGDAAREPHGDLPHRARRSSASSSGAATATSSSSARPRGASARPATPTTRRRRPAIQVGLLLSLKNEIVRIAPRGRVNAVAPGWTYSPMTRGELDETLVSRISRTMALRKVAQAEDVARAVVVLASDELSGHVTGELVTVAGGMEGRTRPRAHEPVPRAAGAGDADRRRRRHGRARSRAQCPACAVPRRRTSARPRVYSKCTSDYIRAGAELIETNSFGANRAKLARAVPRRRARADQRRRGAHRARGAGGRRPRRLHRRLDRAARRRRAGWLRPSGAVCRAGARCSRGEASTCSWSRRSTTSTSSRRRSPRSAPSRLSDRRAADVRRPGGDARGREGGGRGARLRPLGLAAFGANHGAGPAAALAALARMSGDGARAGGTTERRPREHDRPADRLPTRDAGLLRRVRGAGARARRAVDRRLLRHDTGAGRGDPGGRRREPPPGRLLPRPRAQAGGAVRAGDRERRSSRGCSARASSRSRSRSTRRSGRTPRR